MRRLISIEAERVLKKKAKFIAPIGILIMCLFFVNFGANELIKFDEIKKDFLKNEENIISQYLTYDQYGGFGFRLLYQPSSLIIFFENHKLIKNTESTIDVTEFNKISDEYIGRGIFYEGAYKDFGGITIIFGALYMAFMGLFNFKESFLSVLKMPFWHAVASTIYRLLILNGIFALIFIINYLFVLLKGISFTPDETKIFIHFCLIALLYLTFFYSVGLLVSFISKSYKKISLAAVCFIIMVVIPAIDNIGTVSESKIIPSNKALNKEKFESQMDAQKKINEEAEKVKKENKDTMPIRKSLAIKYWAEVFEINQKKEKEFHGLVLDTIKSSENRSILFPSLFFNYVTKESSSKGFSGYKKIIETSMNTRKGFIDYYIKKRYIEEDPVVKPYIETEAQIIDPEIKLPENFWKGFAVTAVYTLVLFLVSFFIIRRRLRKKQQTLAPRLEPEEARWYFCYCKDESIREKLFNFFKQQENTTCIDYIKGEEIDPGLNLQHTLEYFCQLLGTSLERALDYIKTMGIHDLNKTGKTPEAVKKIYFAACLASDKDVVVIKDFIKQESRDFERRFLSLFPEEMEMDRTFIYLGTEIYLYNSPFSGEIKLKNNQQYKFLAVEDPLKILLR